MSPARLRELVQQLPPPEVLAKMSQEEQNAAFDVILREIEPEPGTPLPESTPSAPVESSPNRAEQLRAVVLLIVVLFLAFILAQTHLGGAFGKVLGGACLLAAVISAGCLAYSFRNEA